MGTVFSSILMITGSIASGVLSAIAARAAAKKDWSRARMYAIIAMVVATVLVLAALALLIRSKVKGGEGISIAPGFDISLILMMAVMSAMVALDILAVIHASSTEGQKTRKSEEYSAIAAAMGFAGVIISLVLIIILM